MPKSEAFVRIKSQVLQIVRCIPDGKLCSFQSIGEHLDVVPRHVAYILSQLSAEEKMQLPWWRVVAHSGLLTTFKLHGDGRSQVELLRDEGIAISAKGDVANVEQHFIPIAKLKSGISKQTRPSELPR